MKALLVVGSGLCFGLGLTVIAFLRRTEEKRGVVPPATSRAMTRLGDQGPLLALACAAGVVAGLATGWPVAVPIVAVAVVGLPRLFGQTSGSVSIVKIESIATWTEMLQSTLAASAGLSQAIVATAPLSPAPIRAAAAVCQAA